MPKAKAPDQLTDKHKRFVAEYLKDLNAKQAAIRAGYSPKTAEVQGCQLLRNPKVLMFAAAGAERRLRTLEVTADRVIGEAARLAFANVQDLMDEHGNLLPVKDWPPHMAAAVSSIEVTKRNLEAGDGVQEDVVKVKLWDKPKNLELLFRYLGLLVEKVEHGLSEELLARLDAGRQRNHEEYLKRLKLAGKGLASS